MKKELGYFLEIFWIDKKKRIKIFNKFSWDNLDNVIKNTIKYILEKDKNTGNEVEKKVLNIDKDAIITKLENLWAKKKFSWWIKDNRYDFESKKLTESRMIFRTRETYNWNFITLKKRLDNNTEKSIWKCSIDREFEITVDNINEIIKLIKELWMDLIEKKRRVKNRISYELDWVHFDFDRYDDIPWFLEIESDHEKTVNKWIKKLNLQNFPTANYGPRVLEEHYD